LERGLEEALDQALDASGLSGETREAVEAVIRAAPKTIEF